MTADRIPQPLTDEQLAEYAALIERSTPVGAATASPGMAAALLAEVQRLKGELEKAHAYLDATARLAGRQENRIRRLSPEERAARETDPSRRAAWRMLGKLPHQSHEGGDAS